MPKAPKTKARFKVGNAVTAREFTDCFGAHHQQVEGLTVASVRHIAGHPSYYRIATTGGNGHVHDVEGAERFFTKGT